MSNVTFSAAARRFERAKKFYMRISRLRGREKVNLGAEFALLDSNTVRDTGDIEAVNRWCREACVLTQNETVVWG